MTTIQRAPTERVCGASLIAGLLLALLALVPAARSDAAVADGGWPLANHDLSSTRADLSGAIDRHTVASLQVAWRFPLRAAGGVSGALTATPVAAAGVVYVQDMQSNVFAIDLRTGSLRWKHRYSNTNPGPDGVVVSGARVYGATDTSAFALDAGTGRQIWRRLLISPQARYVDVAPQVSGGTVYLSTVGVPPDGRGALFALSASTGAIRWRLSTIASAWRIPQEAGGGGAWYPPSVDGGIAYWGTANPYPFGGSSKHPNGGAYAGPALYTDSLMAVHVGSGKLAWYDQVTRHDVRDYDFQLSPILATVSGRRLLFGAGKAGIVIAWDRRSHRRVWAARVGEHRSDAGPLPLRRTTVCPGLLGGVETPMAYAGRTLFVPVVDLCMRGSARGYERLDRVDIARRAHGELVALDALTGRPIWSRVLPRAVFGCATVADGVVFTSTFDGQVYALDTRDGTTLWSIRAGAGINSCPALAGGTLLVGSGVAHAGSFTGLTAYRTLATVSTGGS